MSESTDDSASEPEAEDGSYSEPVYSPTVHHDKIPGIVSLLMDAARKRGVVGYPSVYDLFEKVSTRNEHADVWFTFERACATICSPDEAIYGALMALKQTGLPKEGFFAAFYATRPDTYHGIAGHTHPAKLSNEQQHQIAQYERERVYGHAQTVSHKGV